MPASPGLPPIPHPSVKKDARPGPLIIEFRFQSSEEPDYPDWNPQPTRAGDQAFFGPFSTAWIYGGTVMARDENGNEHEVAYHQVDDKYGGSVWLAQDDLLYTDVVFLPVPERNTLAIELLGSLIIEDVKKRVQEATE